MMFWTLYLYELKKIFSNKLKPLVLMADAAFAYIGVSSWLHAYRATCHDAVIIL